MIKKSIIIVALVALISITYIAIGANANPISHNDGVTNTHQSVTQVKIIEEELKEHRLIILSEYKDRRTKEPPQTLKPAQTKPTQSKKPTTKPTIKQTKQPTPKQAQQTSQYSPYKMYIAGKIITYKNGGKASGQSIINNNPSCISTWGGANPWSGTDGKNTHFIGHNYSAFNILKGVGIGSSIVVTDSQGNPTRYIVTTRFLVNHQAIGTDGKDYWDYITGTGGGEVITLQTCDTKSMNLILRAVAK